MGGFRYERPTTLREAARLLAAAPGASVLAGGTDLLVGLRSGVARPELVVDVKRIPELGRVDWTGDGDLVVGACATLARIASDPRIAAAFPALAEGARAVGSLQVRTRATLGGNLVNASPCMDTAPPLLVLRAEVCLASAHGERRLPLEDFFRGVKATGIEPGEILTSIRIPRPARPGASGFEKIRRGLGHDLALVNAAAALDGPEAPLDGPETLRVAIGSCGPVPILLPPVGLAGLDAEGAGDRVARIALERIRPIDDVRASAEYRRDMTALLCRRLAARLLAGAGSER